MFITFDQRLGRCVTELFSPARNESSVHALRFNARLTGIYDNDSFWTASGASPRVKVPANSLLSEAALHLLKNFLTILGRLLETI